MLAKLAAIASGIRNVVSASSQTEMASTPMVKLKLIDPTWPMLIGASDW